MLVSTFLTILRWKTGDIKCSISSCPSSILMKLIKMKEVFEKLNSAAKVNLALGFILRNVNTDEYRYFYAHEKNTVFAKSHLLCSKGDLVSLQDRTEKMDLLETCAQELENTNWRFALTTNLTIFCALLKTIPMRCIDAVLPE